MVNTEVERRSQPRTRLSPKEQKLRVELRTQEKLFQDLEAIGVIGMINSVIKPDVIRPYKTHAQEMEDWKRIKAKQVKEPRATTYMDPKLAGRLWFGMWDQKWTAGVSSPRQREDGSFDPTLRIWISNDTTSFGIYHEEHQIPLKSMALSYSPEHLLMIQGAETTFKGVVIRENVNKDVISTAFKQALQHPTSRHLPSSRPSNAEMSAHCNY
ncbi:MAG: hypothetical protein AAB662_03595 [Patescibacteria group bacterium]